MGVYLEEGHIKVKHSCELCTHVDTCKYYSKTKELFNSNEFYGMTKYLEWNNNLSAWSHNKSCQFYTPYIYNRYLLGLEMKKEKTFLNTLHFWDIAKEYFKETLAHKYEDYFIQEAIKYREKKDYKDRTDEDLFRFLFKISSTKGFIYTISANDESWTESFNLIDMLEHFNMFKDE